MISNRKTDTFDNPAKQRFREHNLASVRSTLSLWDPSLERLRCDVVDLMGESWERTVETYQSILPPQGMVFVDSNTTRIAEAGPKFPEHTFIAGVLETKISKLINDFNVGVLSNDGYKEVASKEATSFFSTVRPLVQKSVETFGAFVLISNNSLSTTYRRGWTPEEALQEHTEAVLRSIENYAPGRVFYLEDLLPGGFEDMVRDPKYIGPVGAYWLYRGKATGARMACLGLRM